MTITIGNNAHRVAWGIRPEWLDAPVAGLPEGGQVVRRKFRPRDMAKVVVRRGRVNQLHCLELDERGELSLGLPIAINKREVF